jgi:hypothetical protein
MFYAVGSGTVMFAPRPWPWYQLYRMNNPVPLSGPPEEWAQYGEGVAGAFYVYPVPDAPYVLSIDCARLPVPLVNDVTAEALPALWTTPVPYYAAYLALLSSPAPQAMDQAEKMFGLFQVFMKRAREYATASILPENYAQVASPPQNGGA